MSVQLSPGQGRQIAELMSGTETSGKPRRAN